MGNNNVDDYEGNENDRQNKSETIFFFRPAAVLKISLLNIDEYYLE